MLCAAGPFSTTDSLSLDPLHSLLDVVEREKPNILLLVSQNPHPTGLSRINIYRIFFARERTWDSHCNSLEIK